MSATGCHSSRRRSSVLTDDCVNIGLVQPEALARDIETAGRRFPVSGVAAMSSDMDESCLRRLRQLARKTCRNQGPESFPLRRDPNQLGFIGRPEECPLDDCRGVSLTLGARDGNEQNPIQAAKQIRRLPSFEGQLFVNEARK